MYDPVTARFLQEDTYTGDASDPLSLNLYTYCHNEPIMYYDPSGNTWIQLYPGHWEDIQFSKQSWEDYKSLSGTSSKGKFSEQTAYFLRYGYDTSYTAASSPAQRGRFEESLQNSTWYNINQGIEEGASEFLWGLIYETPKYIGKTCYDVYGHPIKTLNGLKSDISYSIQNPLALGEGTLDLGKEIVTSAYDDFKSEVLHGDAKL